MVTGEGPFNSSVNERQPPSGQITQALPNMATHRLSLLKCIVGHVRCGYMHRSSASPRPHCDGTPSASVWPSHRQTPCPSCTHPSDRTPPDATMKRVGAPSAWTSPYDLDRKESDGRDPPQGVAPHAHRGVVGAHDQGEEYTTPD